MKITELLIIDKFLSKLTFNKKEALKLKDDIYHDFKKKFVYSTDTYEEKIHFTYSSNPEKFVKKIFRSSISDIYCKGCNPYVYFLNLSIKNTNISWLNRFTKQLKSETKKYGLFLGGGDIVKSKKFSLTFSVMGTYKKNPVLRNNAKINQDIYVTGNLGDSYLGLMTILKKIKFNNSKRYFIDSYEKPKLPVKFSSNLSKFASSSIDISDGFLKDLNSICIASKCGASINFLDLPFSKKARLLCLKNKISLTDIFSKGDDYQILFTASKKYRKLINLTGKKTSTKLTRVGKIISGNHLKLMNGSKNVNLSSIKRGFIHSFN